jgi:hypothetical protein
VFWGGDPMESSMSRNVRPAENVTTMYVPPGRSLGRGCKGVQGDALCPPATNAAKRTESSFQKQQHAGPFHPSWPLA